MRVKILATVTRDEIGSLCDLNIGEIVALDDEIAQKLIEENKAEFTI